MEKHFFPNKYQLLSEINENSCSSSQYPEFFNVIQLILIPTAVTDRPIIRAHDYYAKSLMLH